MAKSTLDKPGVTVRPGSKNTISTSDCSLYINHLLQVTASSLMTPTSCPRNLDTWNTLVEQQRLNAILITWTGSKVSPWVSLRSHSFEPWQVTTSPFQGPLIHTLSLPFFTPFFFLPSIPSAHPCSHSSFHTLPARPLFRALTSYSS